MSNTKRVQKDKRIPREIWIMFDPMKGPLTFTSEKKAWTAYRKWAKEAKAKGPYDAYWEVSEPARYVPLRDDRNNG